jgi:DNA invertase Pin-like site-specific DNA recombinase
MTRPDSSRAGDQSHERASERSSPPPPLPGPSAKIRARHVERLAVVYARQSTLHQVACHRESTALQYDLARYAIAWGWPRDRVLVIDEDLGQSAQSAETRPGFQRLLAEVALDHVGLILGWEMSRLARSCKDWYHQLEVCALSDTLLADQDGLYDPREYKDRLLLGMKGTLSAAETHLLEGRLDQGRWNKAARGEPFVNPPIGYVKLPSGEFALDPDEQVQRVVRLIFDKFDELKSIYRLLRYLVANGIRIGVRPHDGPNRGNLEWRRPSRSTLSFILHHPLYAGAYIYGRDRLRRGSRSSRPVTDSAGRPGAGGVLIWNHCPAYITRERIVELRRSGLTARQIAEQLNAEGWNSCGGRGRFTKDVVICLRRRFGQAGLCPRSRGAAAALGPGEWWASDLARHPGMDPKTLGKWIQTVASRSLVWTGCPGNR